MSLSSSSYPRRTSSAQPRRKSTSAATRRGQTSTKSDAQKARKRRVSKSRKRSKFRVWTATAKWRMRMLGIRLLVLALVGLVCWMFYYYVADRYSSKWQAIYGNEIYPEGYSIHGIDVSHHQGDIDWEKASRAEVGGEPICFVIIKATEGVSHIDENFNENFYQTRQYDLVRGAYHYFKPNLSASQQAKFFLKQVHLEEGDLPPVLDIEERGNLNVKQLQKAALTWLKMVEKQYNVPPIIYTNYKFKVDYLNTPEFNRYPYWIAHYYVRNLTYKGKWRFWQHTDCGTIEGIKGKVDLNIYNGSMYDLKHLCVE